MIFTQNSIINCAERPGTSYIKRRGRDTVQQINCSPGNKDQQIYCAIHQREIYLTFEQPGLNNNLLQDPSTLS